MTRVGLQPGQVPSPSHGHIEIIKIFMHTEKLAQRKSKHANTKQKGPELVLNPQSSHCLVSALSKISPCFPMFLIYFNFSIAFNQIFSAKAASLETDSTIHS